MLHVDVDADFYVDADPCCQQTASRWVINYKPGDIIVVIIFFSTFFPSRWAINYKPGDIPKPATGKRPVRRCVAGCNLTNLNRVEIMTDLGYSASL